MNLKYLQYFCCLAKYQHYPKAAEELGIAQSTLSRIITQMEDELGTYLFEKAGRNIKLTKYGEIYLDHAIKAVEELDAGEKKIRDMINPTYGNIDLAYIYSLGSEFLPSLIEKFSSIKENKNYSFRLYQGTSTNIVQDLKNKKYDLAFCSYIKDEPEIDFTFLIEQELVVIVSHKHPLFEKDSVTLAEAAEYPLILCLDSIKFVEKMFYEAGLIPKVICHVQEEKAITGLVSVNYGIAVIPKSKILKHYNIKMLHLVNSYNTRPFYIATLKYHHLSPAPNAFKDFVIKETKR